MKGFFTGLLLFGSFLAHAQDFSFGKLKKEDFAIDIGQLDTAANAFVIREYGSAQVNYTSHAGLVVEFVKHVRIKILNKEGYQHANFSIPLFKSGNDRETVTDKRSLLSSARRQNCRN